MDLLDAFLIKV